MIDVSPSLTDPTQADQTANPDPAQLREAAEKLRRAIDDLTAAITGGGAIRGTDARDRFEIALADFSALLDTTAT